MPTHHSSHPNGYAHAQPPVPHHYADASAKRPTKPTGTSSLLDVVANRSGPPNEYHPHSSSQHSQGGAFDDDDYELMDRHQHHQTRPRNKEAYPSSSRSNPAPGPENGANGGEGNDGDDKTYCYCERVSFGEMIGCDDENCRREWVRLLSPHSPPPHSDRTPLAF